MRGAFLLSLMACSGGAQMIEVGPPPARATQGLLSGPLCDGPRCACRDVTAADDGGVGVPTDAAHKRFEIRLTSPQELWATIGKARLYKPASPPELCFYVDLPTGETPVELRASDPDGLRGEWTIRELGTITKSFYDTFHFNCGLPGVCSFDELAAIKKTFAVTPERARSTPDNGVRRWIDPCGSTKVKAVTWAHSKAPDGVHPTDLIVSLRLDVYRFAPSKPHGDSSCGKSSNSAGNDNQAEMPD